MASTNGRRKHASREERTASAEVVFEPQMDAQLAVGAADEPARPERAMTPDMENISSEHPSEPPPAGASVNDGHETPVRTAIPGHETRGPGVRTGSSGAASLDAGSGGPRMGERDQIRTRRRRAEEEVG